MANEIRDLIEDVKKGESSQPLWDTISVIASSVPYIGGPLSQLIVSTGGSILFNRIKRLLKLLAEEMLTIKQSAVDKEYLQSEEFFDLFLMVTEATKKTRHEEKIRLFVKIIKGASLGLEKDETSYEDYLNSLSDLTVRELVVLNAIYKQQQDRPEDGESELQWAMRKGWDKLPDQCPEVPLGDFMFILARLAKSGRIVRLSMAAWDNDAQTYMVTETMRKLMAFLDRVEQA